MLSKLLSNVPLRQTEKGRTMQGVSDFNFPVEIVSIGKLSFPAVSGSFSGLTVAARRGSAGEVVNCCSAKCRGKFSYQLLAIRFCGFRDPRCFLRSSIDFAFKDS
jgi:hypothetical protein